MEAMQLLKNTPIDMCAYNYIKAGYKPVITCLNAIYKGE